jgi:hypothetical protein
MRVALGSADLAAGIEVAIPWSAAYGKYDFAVHEVECRDKDVGNRSKHVPMANRGPEYGLAT